MASASIETFCCASTSGSPNILEKLKFDYLSYNIVCAISSVFGLVGALYQVLPNPATLPRHRRDVGHTQKAIINWLAMGDFFATFGILCRSLFWLSKENQVRPENPNIERDMIICSLFAIWIRYFYTVTFLWTLCYAVDVYLVTQQKRGRGKIYHVFTWLTSAVLTILGLSTLYLPKFECHAGFWRSLPNYLLSYIPIVLVMLINPILYYAASKNVRILLAGGLGQLTHQEHELLSALREKFLCIVLVFYVCWLPNVINGIIVWGFWENIPRPLLIAVWYMMAIVNPLQAVLNSLVYKGWDNCDTFCKSLRMVLCACKERAHQGYIIEESSEDYPSNVAEDKVSPSSHSTQVS